MSYSRWTNSEFYTFWSGSGATKKEDEEFCCMFSLDSAPHFCYSEVKDMIKNPDLMRYKITDDLIGKGSFASVYKGYYNNRSLFRKQFSHISI